MGLAGSDPAVFGGDQPMSEQQQQSRTNMILSMRVQIDYGAAVRRWEPRFFELVTVQLKPGYWQLEHRDRRVAGALALEHMVDEKGAPLGFTLVIRNCYMQASPVKDFLRLVIPPEEEGKPAQVIDLEPCDIQYVTGVEAPPTAADSTDDGKPRICLVR
jgi:hypothetical protein